MLRISDFAQLSRVSPKALRLYDRLNLLKPIATDPETGYRYYSATQLSRLNRILVLKDLGFSLEQIGQLLEENLSAETIRALLQMKQTEIQQRLLADQDRLMRVENQLQQLEQEGKMPNYDVVLKSVESQLVAAAIGVIPNYKDCPPVFERLFDQAYSHVARQGIKRVGAGISLYHDTKLRDQNIPVEAAVPIYEPISSSDAVWVYELPSVETMACVVHHGTFTTLGQAYDALLAWIEHNQYQIIGATREVYLQYERNGDPTQYVTEVQVPVEKAN
jgi:DNA-binding transcriptional MerR regulator